MFSLNQTNWAGDNLHGLKITASPRSYANWTEYPIDLSKRALNTCQRPHDSVYLFS